MTLKELDVYDNEVPSIHAMDKLTNMQYVELRVCDVDRQSDEYQWRY